MAYRCDTRWLAPWIESCSGGGSGSCNLGNGKGIDSRQASWNNCHICNCACADLAKHLGTDISSNVSAGGLCFDNLRLLTVGDFVTLQFMLQSKAGTISNVHFLTSARVIRIIPM